MRERQRGFVLITLVALLVMGALGFLAYNLSPEFMQAYRQRQTEAALSEAREALIGYALRYRDDQMAQGTDDRAMYGYLPLPDLGSSRNNNIGCAGEGCDANTFTGITFDANGIGPSVVGRFPWKTLGTSPLRDGHGECLWLIVSALHGRIQRSSPPPVLPPMNWDTLGQFDVVVANGATTLQTVLASAHERPIAIIYSPGPPLPGQDRGTSATDTVTACGGNYDARNYLDPYTATALGGVSHYLAGANHASDTTGDSDLSNDPDAPKAFSLQGIVQRQNDGKLRPGGCPTNATCDIVANDQGLALTADMLFGTIRKSAYFRTDINTLLDRIVGCLRDSIAAGGGPASPYAAIVDDPCYSAADVPPLGYYPNYKEMLFLAAPGGGVNANGDATCAGALLFASQRDSQTLRCPVATPTAAQQRSSPATRGDVCNYLEEINLASYQAAGVDFSGPELFAPVSAEQTAFRDIVRCIPNSPSFVAPTTVVPGLAGPLASYSPTTRTLTLGQTTPTSLSSTVASALSSCAWVPETHSLGAGLRGYFSFRITDAGFTGAATEGFTFAIVDGDNNDLNACGAAAQHIGYSGNNLLTPFIAPPKIGFEIDPKREGGFNPASSNTLTTGRNDPPTSGYAYRGGHVAIVYWGGETSIDTGLTPPCTAPRIDVGGRCYLPQEEDDNVHAQPASARSGFPPPPANPAAPIPPLSVPPDAPAGVYKLDPNRSQVPVNQDFHVRVELNRAPAAYALPTVRAASTGNLNLAAPGASIDGIRLFNGDRVLVKDQSVAGENGIYVWRGALTAMARATDADSAVELAGLLIEVQQGTQARSIWRQKETHPTLGADPLRWANSRVKVATRTDLDLTTPGVSINGIRMAAGDRVLVKAQSIAADNGIYLWNGSASLMTRASDADTATELTGLVVQVQQGEDATAWWRFDGAIWSRLAVKVASQANLDLAAPGPSIDGVALTAGDRVLVKAQDSAPQNGIYLWNGAASPMTRAPDADTAAELAGRLTQVQAGTDTGRTFRQSSLAYVGTLGADAVQWTALDPSPNFLIEIWILPDSPTDANRIAAMKNTTRPMSLLSPGFTPHLRDAPIIGYPFRNARIGFTLGQRTTRNDQTFSISDITTSWLP